MVIIVLYSASVKDRSRAIVVIVVGEWREGGCWRIKSALSVISAGNIFKMLYDGTQ